MKIQYVSKNKKLVLINSGYNNKIYLCDTHTFVCEFTDTYINAVAWVEKRSKMFD